MAEPAYAGNLIVFLSPEEVAAARDLLSHLQAPVGAKSGRVEGASLALCELAGRIYALRRERRHFFSEDLFADPAWDMLLYLYCAQIGGKETSVTSLIYAAEVPQSTGLRWVQILTTCALVERHPHLTDRRRVLVTLTDDGWRRVEEYLSHTVQKLFPSLVMQTALKSRLSTNSRIGEAIALSTPDSQIPRGLESTRNGNR